MYQNHSYTTLRGDMNARSYAHSITDPCNVQHGGIG